MRVWSFGCQGTGCRGISVARRKYILVDSRPASLLATATEIPLQPVPLASVVAQRSIGLTRILIKTINSRTRLFSRPFQLTAEIKGMGLGSAPLTRCEYVRVSSGPASLLATVTVAEPRTMLPPFPTHTKPKQDSSHA
jgi:hypothetical protein